MTESDLLEKYMEILISSLSKGICVPFDCFFFLKRNQKMIRVVEREIPINEKLIEKLKNSNMSKLYILKEDENNYSSFLKEFFESEEGSVVLSDIMAEGSIESSNIPSELIEKIEKGDIKNLGEDADKGAEEVSKVESCFSRKIEDTLEQIVAIDNESIERQQNFKDEIKNSLLEKINGLLEEMDVSFNLESEDFLKNLDERINGLLDQNGNLKVKNEKELLDLLQGLREGTMNLLTDPEFQEDQGEISKIRNIPNSESDKIIEDLVPAFTQYKDEIHSKFSEKIQKLELLEKEANQYVKGVPDLSEDEKNVISDITENIESTVQQIRGSLNEETEVQNDQILDTTVEKIKESVSRIKQFKMAASCEDPIETQKVEGGIDIANSIERVQVDNLGVNSKSENEGQVVGGDFTTKIDPEDQKISHFDNNDQNLIDKNKIQGETALKLKEENEVVSGEVAGHKVENSDSTSSLEEGNYLVSSTEDANKDLAKVVELQEDLTNVEDVIESSFEGLSKNELIEIINNQKLTIKRMQSENIHIQKDIENMTQLNNEFEPKVLVNQVKEGEEIESLSHDELLEKLKAYQNENESLKESFSSFRGKMNQLKDKIGEKLAEQNNQATNNDITEKKKDTNIEKDNDTPKSENTEANNLQKLIKDLQKKLESESSDHANTKQKLVNSLKENKSLVNSRKSREEQIKEFVEFVNKNTDYIGDIEEENKLKDQRIRELEKIIQDKRHEEERWEDLRRTLETNESSHLADIKRLQEEVNDLRIKDADSKKELQKMRELIKKKQKLENDNNALELTQTLEQKQSELNKIEEKHLQVIDRMKNLEKEIVNLKTAQDNVGVLKGRLGEKLADLEEKKKLFTKERDGFRNKISGLENLNLQSRKTIERLTKSNDNLKLGKLELAKQKSQAQGQSNPEDIKRIKEMEGRISQESTKSQRLAVNLQNQIEKNRTLQTSLNEEQAIRKKLEKALRGMKDAA